MRRQNTDRPVRQRHFSRIEPQGKLNSTASLNPFLTPKLRHALENWPGPGVVPLKVIFVHLKTVRKLLQEAHPKVLADELLLVPFINRLVQTLHCDDYRIRSVGLAIFRVLTVNESRLRHFLKRIVDIFAVRSLDGTIEVERTSALRLLSAMLDIYLKSELRMEAEMSNLAEDISFIDFPYNALRAIKSLVFNYKCELSEEHDRISTLVKSAIGILLKLSITEPELVIKFIGTDWIPFILSSPALNIKYNCILLSRVISKWLQDPKLRELADMKSFLVKVFAPLLDLGFFQQADVKQNGVIATENFEITTQRVMNACSIVMKQLLCTWSGFLALACDEKNSTAKTHSPLNWLNYLGLTASAAGSHLQLIYMTVNVCAEFFDRPYSKKDFMSWEEALEFYARTEEPDEYDCAVHDQFVVGELKNIMDKGFIKNDHTNPLTSYRAIVAYVLIYNGLGQCLGRLITQSPNESMMIKATLLLADLFRISALYLPKNWKIAVMSTPMLMNKMTKALLHEWELNLNKKTSNRGASVLLHRLDEVNTLSFRLEERDKLADLPYTDLFIRKRPLLPIISDSRNIETNEEKVNECLHIAHHERGFNWKEANYILQVFLGSPKLLQRFRNNEKCHHFFVEILNYFSPKTEKAIEGADKPKLIREFRTGLTALRIVSQMAETEPYYREMLHSFITDFVEQQDLLMTSDRSTLVSRKVTHGNAELYYALIATIADTPYGHTALQNTQFYQKEMPTQNHEKLMLVSQNYEHTIGRKMLEIALTASNEEQRKWATRFVEVLLCCDESDPADRKMDWAISLLINQLVDPSPKVQRSALLVLFKWLPKYPKKSGFLEHIRVSDFGDAGELLEAVFMADEEVVKKDQKRAKDAISRWMKGFASQYVRIFEDDLLLAMGFPKRSLDYGFARHSTIQRKVPAHMIVPCHLFDSLTQHQFGLRLLVESDVLHQLGTILRRNLRIADLDELNGALLSLGNIIGNLEEHDLQGIVEPDTVQKIVFLAENCPHLHVRGVAFMAINLIAKSEYGTQKLIEAEWEVNRRPEMQTSYEMKKRNEHFGILESPKFEPKFQKAPKKNSSPSLSPKMRPARSDSMFMRAGNEALAALRAKKYTRRKSSSNSMSTPHTEHTHENTPSILENDLSEDTFELDAVSFDFQIMKTLNRNKDDHEKYHAHSVNSKNIIRPEDLVPENYMETVKFARVDTLPVSEQDTDIWILSDPEKQSMQQLRALLDGREGISSSLKSDVTSTRKEWNPEEDGIACPVVALPSEPTNMLKNIFLPYQPETSLQSDPNTELNVSDESHNTTSSIDIVLSKGHRHEKCFYCVTKKRPWNMFVKVRDPEEYRQKEYEECREEILKTIGILELREQVTTTRLANWYDQNPALFTHPCLYADVLLLLSDANFSADARAFIQNLFFDVFENVSLTNIPVIRRLR